MKREILLAAVFSLFSASSNAEPRYSTVYVFGDSLSDRGRIPGLLEKVPHFPPTFIFPKSPYFDGRFSNGPTWAERLPTLIGVAPAPDQNFAVGGAETGYDNLANDDLASFNVKLPGIRTEIDAFTGSGGRFGESAVTVMYGGANDYFAFLGTNPTPADVPVEVASVTGNIYSNIHALASAGARTILVPNIPDLGSTPSYRNTDQAAVAGALSEQHAAALNAQLGRLAEELNIDIFVADFSTGLNTILLDPQRFGFTNVTDACVTANAPSFPTYLFPGPACLNPDQHLFWDDVHPTSPAHQLLAGYAADTLLAPLTIGPQAALSLNLGDSFLLRAQKITLGSRSDGNASTLTKSTPEGQDVFLAVERNSGDVSSGNEMAGFDYGVTRVSGGVILRPSTDITLGLIGGYDDGQANLLQSRGSIELTSLRLGGVAGYDNGALFAGAGLAYSFDEYGLNRQTHVPQLQSSAETDGRTFGAFGSVGYRFNFGAITAGPLLGLRYTDTDIEQYREWGAPGLDMIVQSQGAKELIGSVGIVAKGEFALGASKIMPHLELGLESDLLDDNRTIETALATVPDVVRTLSVSKDEDVYGRLGGGVSLMFNSHVKGHLSGETTIGRSGNDEHSVFFSLSGTF
jgi:outer membrane lipase/esterase